MYALCICVGHTHTHTQNERVHAKVNCVPQGDPGVFLDLQTAARKLSPSRAVGNVKFVFQFSRL